MGGGAGERKLEGQERRKVNRREEETKREKGSRKGERRRGPGKKGRLFAFCSHCHYLKS